MDKVKQTIKRNWKTTQLVAKNVLELTDAAALAGVAGFAIYKSLGETAIAYRVLLFAGVLIALQAALLLVRSLNKQPVKK